MSTPETILTISRLIGCDLNKDSPWTKIHYLRVVRAFVLNPAGWEDLDIAMDGQ